MSQIEFVKPTVALAEELALDMRRADVEEIWASSHRTPKEALMEGLHQSDLSAVAVCDGVPLIMFGVVKRDLLSGTGIVWMLGANAATKYRRNFLTLAPRYVDEMLNFCPRLTNMVHSKNRESIRWLKWLGFTVDPPTRYGRENQLFHNFHIERH